VIASRSFARLGAGARILSFAEFVAAGAVVIAHNVFGALPNEVPILTGLCIASVALRNVAWRAVWSDSTGPWSQNVLVWLWRPASAVLRGLGLGRPKSWALTILISLVAAVAIIATGEFVTEPLAKQLGLHATNAGATVLGPMRGNPGNALRALGLVWTFAAFGEELGYRRYILGRAADAGGGTAWAYALALLAASVLFGFGHYYQGPAGIFTTACDGFMLGLVYLLARRNLWVAVFTHGLVDTIGIALLFFGIAD